MTASATDPHIGLVVEGRGDVFAVPLLLRGCLYTRQDFREILGKPIPLNGKGSATRSGGIEGYVGTAAARPGCRAIIVVLDADDEPSCREGPRLLARARSATGLPVLVAIAERDYEDWLYASIERLEIDNFEFVPGRNGANEIRRSILPGAYVKPIWQPRLTARMDIDLATSRNTSLRRFLTRFDEIVESHF